MKLLYTWFLCVLAMSAAVGQAVHPPVDGSALPDGRGAVLEARVALQSRDRQAALQTTER